MEQLCIPDRPLLPQFIWHWNSSLQVSLIWLALAGSLKAVTKREIKCSVCLSLVVREVNCQKKNKKTLWFVCKFWDTFPYKVLSLKITIKRCLRKGIFAVLSLSLQSKNTPSISAGLNEWLFGMGDVSWDLWQSKKCYIWLEIFRDFHWYEGWALEKSSAGREVSKTDMDSIWVGRYWFLMHIS